MSRKLRIAVGMLHQESNSFNSRRTTAQDLEVTRGQAVIDRWAGTDMPLGGALQVLQQEDVELCGAVAAAGTSGGELEDQAALAIKEELVSALAATRADAVYLDLHGALISASGWDVSGNLLAGLDRAVGPDVPIAVSLDSHACLTEELVGNADVLVGFKTYPHVDYGATGARAAKLLLKLLGGRLEPRVRVVKLPMIQPPEVSDTSSGPLAPLIRALAQAENAGSVVDGSLFYAQPWLDVGYQGSAVSITMDGDGSRAAALALSHAWTWWTMREQFEPRLLEARQAVREAVRSEASTVLISEAGDAINAGADGDNPTLIEAMMECVDGASALTFTCDPDVLRQVAASEVGQTVTVTFGRQCDPRFATPFTAPCVVEARAEGRFRLSGTYFNGLEQDMGGAVVLRAEGVRVLVARRPVICSEPALYRCADLEPARFKVVGIKSPASFRPNFAAISTMALVADVGGASSPRFRALPWQRVNRPLFPLDPEAVFEPTVWTGRRG
jgi:microcystin degradation protein MlrC